MLRKHSGTIHKQMYLLKIKILFLILLAGWQANAATRPNFLIDEKAIVEEYRGSIRSKLAELSQNYLAFANASSIVWNSSDQVDCRGVLTPRRQALAAVYMSKSEGRVSFEMRGCGSQVLLRETFEVADAAEMTLVQYLSGSIPNDIITYYRLEDGGRNSIFEWRTQQGASAFFFLGQRFLDIYKENSRWQYKLIGYEARYFAENFGLGVEIRHDDNRLSVDWSGQNVRIYDSDQRLISINKFLTAYSSAVQATTMNFASTTVQYWLKKLPATEFVSSTGQNSRLLDELRLTYTRLLNNIELNLVRQYIQELVSAVENGLLQITDNRPEAK